MASSSSSAAPSWREKLPDKPLLISGGLGGPAVIYLCTPLRNGLTLGSQDKKASTRALYRKVFRGGPGAGWIGGAAPAVVACPQFLALGPVYHFLNAQIRDALRGSPVSGTLSVSVLASLGAAAVETGLTFGSQARNAQMAYNNSMVSFASVVDGSRSKVPLCNVYDVWGPGAAAMLMRNFLSVMSIRSFSPWLRERFTSDFLSPNARATLCDITASLVTCSVTAPVSQIFNFLVTTPQAGSLSTREQLRLAKKFLREQYFVPLPREELLTVDFSKPVPEQQYSWRISKVALRDFGMRSLYVTTVFTLFVSFERTLIGMMR